MWGQIGECNEHRLRTKIVLKGQPKIGRKPRAITSSHTHGVIIYAEHTGPKGEAFGTKLSHTRFTGNMLSVYTIPVYRGYPKSAPYGFASHSSFVTSVQLMSIWVYIFYIRYMYRWRVSIHRYTRMYYIFFMLWFRIFMCVLRIAKNASFLLYPPCPVCTRYTRCHQSNVCSRMWVCVCLSVWISFSDEAELWAAIIIIPIIIL